MGFTLSPQFIGSFKTGDNIVYNFEILNSLYYSFDNASGSQKHLLIKPITIIIGSIIESIIWDLFLKLETYSSEGVPNIETRTIEKARKGTYEGFKKQLDFCKKYNIFFASMEFYKELEEIKKTRDRIHIQNHLRDDPKNEKKLFTFEIKEKAERSCEYIIKIMNKKYYREINCVEDFKIPWKEKCYDFSAP